MLYIVAGASCMTCTMYSVKALQLLLHTETGRYSRRFMQTLTCREALFFACVLQSAQCNATDGRVLQ